MPPGGWNRPVIAGLPGVAGSAWDEYPFASTLEYVVMSSWGGVSVQPVPAWQQRVQGGELKWFYNKALKNKPGLPFFVVVVDVPLPTAGPPLTTEEESQAY